METSCRVGTGSADGVKKQVRFSVHLGAKRFGGQVRLSMGCFGGQVIRGREVPRSTYLRHEKNRSGRGKNQRKENGRRADKNLSHGVESGEVPDFNMQLDCSVWSLFGGSRWKRGEAAFLALVWLAERIFTNQREIATFGTPVVAGPHLTRLRMNEP